MKIIAIILLLSISGCSLMAVLGKIGAEDIEHPAGLSLRQKSLRTGGIGFFSYYHTRSHYGGGLRGGK
ncbi:hypothetical protein [Desulfonema magnum]|uniref:Lipoprotein n=1 Tax=Desulfonema magnum TaxID=45655 RepID=A0A975BQL0_9BACT|nr:hypothetical protein [Desulfonema magnum]QTA90049.1 Uncharacterized protein dnm_061090 [Desulfonema magnum]